MNRDRSTTWLLYPVFFLSGAAALLFETLWFRQAGLTFGNSVWASSLVLSAFMAGLAAGNYLCARFGHRFVRPVRLYAILEIIIAVTGVGLVLLFPLLNEMLAPLFRPMIDQPLIINPIRLSIGFALLIVPAMSMGATLPVLVKGLTGEHQTFGRVLGMLYGCNTLGAFAGALAGELWLIDWFGVRGTAYVAGAADVVAAVAALAVARGLSSSAAPLPERSTISRRAGRLMAAAFLAGGLLLALEVVWFRFILLFTGGTSLTFAVMLAVVLMGIGLGGFIGGALPGGKLAPGVALLGGALVAGGYYAFPTLFGIAYVNDDWINFQRAMRLMFPVCLLSGVLFTLIGRSLHEQIGSATRSAGLLTLANTTGAMLGPLIAGFVMLPTLGVERSFAVLAAGYGAVAILLFERLRPALFGAAALFVAALIMFPFGLMTQRIIPSVVDRFANDGSRLIAHREGTIETILYLRADRFGEPRTYRLVTNGLAMSSTFDDAQRYMKMFVYLPVALHPNPRKALLISYGVGTTAKALTDTRQLERIDVVDISRDVLEMNDIVFPDPATHPLNDPRVTVHIEDGRFFLQTSDQQYDLITGEPPPPKAAGIVNLYTREYFQLIHDRLAPGGMCTYWLPVYQLSESDNRAIVCAFADVFDECSLWTGSGAEWILLGVRKAAKRVTAQQYAQPWRDPIVGPEMRSLGFELPEQIPTLFIADGPMLRRWFADAPPLVDNYPHRLSPIVDLPMDSRYPDLIDPRKAQQRLLASDHIRRLFPPSVVQQSLPLFAFRLDVHDAMTQYPVTAPALPHASIQRVLTTSPLRTLVLWKLHTTAQDVSIAKHVAARDGANATLHTQLGHAALATRDYTNAARHYAAAGPNMFYNELFALCMAGDVAAAQGKVSDEPSVDVPPQFRQLWWRFMNDKFGLRPAQ